MLDAYRVYLLIGAGAALFVGILDPIVAVYYVRVVGLNPIELVLLGTIVEATSFLCQVPTGAIADAYSRRLAVIVGYLLEGVCFTLQGLFPLLLVIAGAELLRGVGRTFINGALEAWIADEIGERRVGAAFIRNTQIKQIAGVVGTAVGAGIATIALGLPLLIGGLGLLALTAGLVVVMPEHNHRRAPRDERGSWHVVVGTARAGIGAIRGQPVLITFLGLWGVFALCTEGMDRLWEAHLLASFTFPTFGGLDSVVWFGAINVAFMLGSVVVAEVVRRTVDTTNGPTAARVLFVFSAVRVVGVVVFGLAGSFEVAVGAYLVSMVLRSVSQPIFTGWVNRSLDPRTRATVLSMGGQVDAAGQLTGGPLIGLIGQLVSLRAAMVAAGLVLAPALPLIARATAQEGRSTRAPRLDQPAEVI